MLISELTGHEWVSTLSLLSVVPPRLVWYPGVVAESE